ncbi:MAG: hypothetical protein AB1779_06575, partial [Candidatus Thermoplasmatota archaeon]
MKKALLLVVALVLYQGFISLNAYRSWENFELLNPFPSIALNKNDSFTYMLIAENLGDDNIKINLTYSIPIDWKVSIPSSIYLPSNEKKTIEVNGKIPENCEIGLYNITIVGYVDKGMMKFARTAILISNPPKELELNTTEPLYLETGDTTLFELGIKNLESKKKELQLGALAPNEIDVKLKEKKLSIEPLEEEKFLIEVHSNVDGRNFFLITINDSYSWAIPILAFDEEINFTYEDINAYIGRAIKAKVGINTNITSFEVFTPSNWVLNNVKDEKNIFEANISIPKNSSLGTHFILWNFEEGGKNYFIYNMLYLSCIIEKSFQLNYIHSIGAYIGDNVTTHIGIMNLIGENIELKLSYSKPECWQIELEFYSLILEVFEREDIEVLVYIPGNFSIGTYSYTIFVNDTNGYFEEAKINVSLRKRENVDFVFDKLEQVYAHPGDKLKTQAIVRNKGDEKVNLSLYMLTPENWSWELDRNNIMLEKNATISITIIVPLNISPGEFHLFLVGEVNEEREWVELVVIVETEEANFSLRTGLGARAKPGSEIKINVSIENFGSECLYRIEVLAPKRWDVKIEYKEIFLKKNEKKEISANIKIPMNEREGTYYIEWIVSSKITKRASTVVNVYLPKESFVFVQPKELKLRPSDYGGLEIEIKNLLEEEILINLSIFLPNMFQTQYFQNSIILAPLSSSKIIFSFFVNSSAEPGEYNFEVIGKEKYCTKSLISKIIVCEVPSIEISTYEDYIKNIGTVKIAVDIEMKSIEMNITYPNNITYNSLLSFDGSAWYGNYSIPIDGDYFILITCVDKDGYKLVRGFRTFVMHKYDVYLKAEGKELYKFGEVCLLKIIIKNIGNSPDNYTINLLIDINETFLTYLFLLPN